MVYSFTLSEKLLFSLITVVISLLITVFFIFRRSKNIFALRNIVHNMKECIAVIDSDNRIIYYNKSFSANLAELINFNKGNTVEDFVKKLYKVVENDDELKKIESIFKLNHHKRQEIEITVKKPERINYNLSVHQLQSSNKTSIGKVILLSDITEFKSLADELCLNNSELAKKNNELLDLNKKLKKHISSAEELAIIKERNRLSLDICSTLRYSMSLLLAFLDKIHAEYRINPDSAIVKLDEAINIARENICEIRGEILGIGKDKMNEDTLCDILKKMADNFRYLGVQINILIEKYGCYENDNYCETIYKICQEAISNSIRHGKAGIIGIVLEFNKEIIVRIKDNGIGCKIINKQSGLTAMEQRIKELNGNIEYFSAEEMGFMINIRIPRNEVNISENTLYSSSAGEVRI